jgi:hypothetical protein
MAESIFNNNWGKVALGSTPKIKDSFRSDVTASNLPGKKKKVILISTSMLLQSGKASIPGQQLRPY